MCFILLKTNMMCMCITICFKQINGCVESIICPTSYICELMDEFLVSWPLLLLLYKIYVSLSVNQVHKKNKKHQFRRVFCIKNRPAGPTDLLFLLIRTEIEFKIQISTNF
jgi:hypothetical protein